MVMRCSIMDKWQNTVLTPNCMQKVEFIPKCLTNNLSKGELFGKDQN